MSLSSGRVMYELILQSY